ncbi:hypothetical protein ACFLS8_00795 [Chloroflexota bacterium]
MARLKKLSGGEKQLWIKNNWAEIETYYERNGFEATCKKYRMKVITLERFLRNAKAKKTCQVCSTNDELTKLRVEVLRSDVAGLRGEIRELKETYGLFIESVAEQVKLGLLIPLLRSSIKVPRELASKAIVDALRLDDSGEHGLGGGRDAHADTDD